MLRIIQDSREQNYLFPRDKVLHRKLDEGDYSSVLLEDHLTIERKSPSDLYSTLASGHQRFKREIQRCEQKNKTMIIAVECRQAEFLAGEWAPLKLKRTKNFRKRLLSISKIISTMEKKYEHITFRWLPNRTRMKQFILLQLCEAEYEFKKNNI